MSAPLWEDRFHLCLDGRLPEPMVLPVCGGTAVLCSIPSPDESDRVNEDGALIAELDDQGGVLCVADGAGGLRRGDLACKLALESLAAALAAKDSGSDLRSRVMSAFEDAHQRIISLGIGAATTLAGVIIHGGRLRSFHAGDSRILVTGQRGRKKLASLPHSPVAYAVEAGFLDEEAALSHDQLHLVSNLVGISDARIDLSASIRLAPRDTVLIASDGLFDNFLPDEVVERVRTGDLVESVRELMLEAGARMRGEGSDRSGKMDDLTILAYRPGPGDSGR
ncbi:MAG: protein phosphatase 2C domain-containing protein [Planctomycetota bacterium]